MDEAIILPITCPTLVGRARPLAALRLQIERMKQGQGQVMFICGEAGVGKSRLIAETKAELAAQNCLILEGNCFPTDVRYPYAPLLDLVRSLLATKPAEISEDTIETLAHDLFPLLPELLPDKKAAPMQLQPEQEKHRLFAVLAAFFLRLAKRTPVMLFIEDIHWSDDTSLEFLHYLARRTVSQPLLLLCTYRLDEVQAPLRNWLTGLNRERLGYEIRLTPLARDEIEQMLTAMFAEPRISLDMRHFLHGELLDVLSTLTEGNPFFIEEMIGALIAANDIFYVQGYWHRKSKHEIAIPRSLQDVVHRRIADLSDDARSVLILAAVAGRRFDFALLQHLTQYDEQQLLLSMKELVSAQLVVEESPDQFAFRHALTRQAIYTQLLTRERRNLHRAIAETMEQRFPAQPAAHLEDLALHFYQARDWQKTADYARRAGEKALQLYTHRAAIDYFTWALEAVDHLGQPVDPQLYLARGQAYEMLGEFEGAQKNYQLAIDVARATNNRIAEWQCAINLGFVWAGHDYARAETWFRLAITLAGALDDQQLQARSLNRIGNWHLNVEQPQEAVRYHQEALTLFERQHDSQGIAETLDLLGMSSYLGGDLIAGTDYYRQAIMLFEQLGDKPGLASSLATLALRAPTYQTDSMAASANLDEASRDAEHALVIAREIGQRSAEAYALLQLGLCRGSQGNYTPALTAARRSLEIAQEIEHREWQTAAHTVLGAIYSSLCVYTLAREHFVQALQFADEMGSLFWSGIARGYLASVVVSQNDLTLAEQVLQPAILEAPTQTMAQRLLWCAAVELALAQGVPERALTILDRLTTLQTPAQAGLDSLRILKLRGETLLALHRSDEALEILERAHALASAQEARPMQWRIACSLGTLYQTRGEKTKAEEASLLVRTVVDELATAIPEEPLRVQFQDQVLALFPQVRPPVSHQDTRGINGSLTTREREVAILIAHGKSNQAIADSLVVTKRTVETHISNIMFKLAFSSRTQIAVWVMENGLISKHAPESS